MTRNLGRRDRKLLRHRLLTPSSLQGNLKYINSRVEENFLRISGGKKRKDEILKVFSAGSPGVCRSILLIITTFGTISFTQPHSLWFCSKGPFYLPRGIFVNWGYLFKPRSLNCKCKSLSS